MRKYLRELFEAKDDTRPLFDRQIELARELYVERGEEGNFNSYVTFISQIVNGQRKLPPTWREPLKAVVRRRAEELQMNSSSITRILASIDCAHSQGTQGVSLLIAEQAVARDTLILNASPLELSDVKRDHTEAVALQRIVFEGLHQGRKYHYGVASHRSALQLWRAFLASVEEEHKQSAVEMVQRWVEHGLLRISVVPELLLLNPMVAYNTNAPDKLKVYIWHAPYDWERVLELPIQQNASWLGTTRHVLETKSKSVACPF